MRVAFLGDIVGKGGRRLLANKWRPWKLDQHVDFTIANGENLAGTGITPNLARKVLRYGIDVITSGNHIWKFDQIIPLLEDERFPLIRPLNYNGAPGKGSGIFNGVAVINLLSPIGMAPHLVGPMFKTVEREVLRLREMTPIIIVDVHGEITADKIALAYYLDGKVSAVIGTHTHVPTNDAKILEHGTAYITDVGMVGATRSVIGVKKEIIIEHLITGLPKRFDNAREGVKGYGVLIDIDDRTGKSYAIEPFVIEG